MDSDAYKESLERETQLRKQGFDGAADVERNARQDYLRDGGYDSPDGGKQVHYNGSKQQQDDLDAIDKYMKEHPEFR